MTDTLTLDTSESTGRPSALVQALRVQSEAVRSHPVVAQLVLAAAGSTIYYFWQMDDLLHGVGYLFAMWLCVFVTDVVAVARRSAIVTPTVQTATLPVRDARRETLAIAICTALGVAGLWYRYNAFADWSQAPGYGRMLMLPLLLFVFPIALAIWMLLKGYRPKDFGLRVSTIISSTLIYGLPAFAITGLMTYLVAPQNIHWSAALEEEGILGILFSGFIVAALSEEFWRVLAITRLEALTKNAPLALLVSSAVWGAMHIPTFLNQSHDGLNASLAGVNLIPLGIMWGYLTYRSRSLWPALLVHGLNLWGLQNASF